MALRKLLLAVVCALTASRGVAADRAAERLSAAIAPLASSVAKTRSALARTRTIPSPELRDALTAAASVLADADVLLAIRPPDPPPGRNGAAGRAELERWQHRVSALVAAAERASDALSVAAKDPCLPDAQRAYSLQESGRLAEATPIFERLAGMPCFDEGINRDAAEFLRDWARAAPPPVAASPPAPAADRAVPTPTPPTPAALSRSETSVQSQITLDVWQSAWRDFAGFDALVAYFGRNRITAVNFNPGQSIRPGAAPEAYEQLRALVAQLRRGGVTAVNYLYAELEYDIAAYASFIRKHPDLGIDTIVDDSEFSDAARPRFERNMKVVRDAGLRYSAFVTVEPAGNSGVSDELRLWAIDNVDEPILMSYFSCALAEQKKVLRPYFEHADATGRERFLRVAILLGSKSVGLERSCERELDVAALQSFLCDLDAWCRRYKSYAGLVLETNKKLPPEVRRQ